MFFKGDGCDFSNAFHFVDHKGDHREIKSPGWRIEMKCQCRGVGKADMELELIEVYLYEIVEFFNHCRSSGHLVKAFGNFENTKKVKILLRFEPLAVCQLF